MYYLLEQIDCLELWRCVLNEVRMYTAEIQNSNSRQNSGRHSVPTNGLNSRRIQNPKGFSTLRVAPRLPMQIHKW